MPKPHSYKHLSSSLAAKSAEVDDDEKDMEDETPPADDKEKGKKSKKAKKAEKDEDETSAESDDSEKKDEAKKASVSTEGAVAEQARLEERLRCAQIFGSEFAAGRLETACQFAFHTDMSAATAIGIMATLPKGSATVAAAPRQTLDQRMAAAPKVAVGADAAAGADASSVKPLAEMNSTQKALAIVNAGRASRGEELLTKLN
jgi:hypothetical protein